MKLGSENVLKSCACSGCGEVFDRASCVGEDKAPRPGDVTVCIRCGHIMAFANDLSFRELTDAEMRAVAGDKRLIALQKARNMVMSKKFSH